MRIAVYLEKNPVTGALRDVSVELTAKAFSLVQAQGHGEVIGLFAGDDLPSNLGDVFRYGMDRAVVLKNPLLKNFQPFALKQIFVAMIKKENPDCVLFGATHNGRELAPLISSTLGTGLTADCTQLQVDEYKDKGKILFQIRPAFGGNILATIITPDHRPMMATVRENVMMLPEQQHVKTQRVENFAFDLSAELIKNEFLSIIPKENRINLGASQIIVAGGAGVGSKDNFKLIHALAKSLGGEVAASRAAVDFGYAPKERLVGQTGSVVRPKLYIACGISGSIQHRAGMEQAKKIVAINTDPEAPIFKIAHMGIVGDLREVIPVMLNCLKEE